MKRLLTVGSPLAIREVECPDRMVNSCILAPNPLEGAWDGKKLICMCRVNTPERNGHSEGIASIIAEGATCSRLNIAGIESQNRRIWQLRVGRHKRQRCFAARLNSLGLAYCGRTPSGVALVYNLRSSVGRGMRSPDWGCFGGQEYG